MLSFLRSAVMCALVMLCGFGQLFAAAPIANAGNALDFDGADDFVATSLNAQPAGLAVTTWEAWINPTRINHTDWQGILTTDDGGWDRGIWITAGSNSFSIGCGAQFIPPVTVTTNAWHHIAIVFKADNVLFYYDGQEYSFGSAPSGQATIYNLTIGANVGGTIQRFQGAIDEVRVWNTARTKDEIRQNMYYRLSGSESGLVAAYRCDADSGTTLDDITGNGWNGTLNNMDNSDWVASAAWDVLMVNEDDTVSFTTGYDADNDSFTCAPVTAPVQGSLTLDNSAKLGRYIPDPDFFGADTFSYYLTDTTGAVDSQTVYVTVNNINEAPSFTMGGNDTVLEDAGACTVAAWASGLSAGPVNESSQTLTFVLTADNPTLFGVQPAVSGTTGNLTYTPAAYASGSSLVRVYLQDNGGTSLGGSDVSATDSFLITVTPANDDAPLAGPDDGNALDFDGTNDYVSAAPGVPTGNSTYTLEAWIYPDQMGTRGIIGWGNYGSTNQCNAIRLTSNGLVHYWWGNDLTVVTGSITGAWHHVAATFNGATRCIYLDGNLIGSDTPAGHNASSANFGIGVTNFSEFFDGRIDEVRIWNTARTAEEIRRLMFAPLDGDESGLVVYYRFDAVGGTVLPDQTAGASNGTLVNMDNNDWVGSAAWALPAVAEEETLVLSAGYDPDGDSVTVAEVTAPVYGTLSIDNNATTITYIPDADFFGIDSFTCSLTDTTGLVDTVTLRVTVNNVNDAPGFTAGDDDTVTEDAGACTTTAWATAINAGPGESSQTLTFVLAADNPLLFGVQPAVNSATGDLTFTPAPDAHGQSLVRVYLQDNGGTSLGGVNVSATDSFIIVVTPISDDPPMAGLDAGNAGDFDGSNDHVRISGLTNLSGSQITIEYWFKGSYIQSAVRQQSDSGYIVAGWNNMHLLSNDGGTSGLSVDGNGGATARDGNWHHIAFSWKQNTVNGFVSYIDGRVASMRTSGTTAIPNMANDLILGSYLGSSEFMVGQLDEVRIWNVARTAAEIKNHRYVPLAGDEPGLVAYYRFDQSQGSLLPDYSVNGWDGTLTNMADNDWVANPAWDVPPVNEEDTLVLSAGYDPDGDSVTGAEVTAPVHGTLSFDNNTTTITYIPEADFFGTDSCTYSLTDTTGLADTVTLRVTVNNINDAPTRIAPAGDITFAEEAGDSSIDLSTVFADQEDSLTYWYYAPAQTAIETVLYDGFEGALNPAYWTTFSMSGARVTRTTSSANSGSYSVLMDATRYDTYVLNEMTLTLDTRCRRDLAVSFYYRVNTDYEIMHAMPATFTSSSNCDGVAVSVDGYTWYRLTSLAATAAYRYTTCTIDSVLSAAGVANTGLLRIKFQQYDRYPTPYCGIFFDDVRVSGTRLNSGNLDITVNGDGQVNITGKENFTGTENLVFAAEDASLATAFDTVLVTVTPLSDPPEVTSTAIETLDVNSPYVYIGTAFDPDSDAVTISFENLPAWLTVSGDTLQGTAPMVGDTGFTIIATDGMYADTQRVTLTVMYINDAPSFTAGGSDTSLEDAGAVTVTGWATGLYAGAVDESTQTLSFAVTNNNNALFQVQPAVDSITGNLTYTPAVNEFSQARVYVRLRDNGGIAQGGCDTSALESLLIVVTPVNDAPVAAADTFTTAEDETLRVTVGSGVVANDADIDLVDPSALMAYWSLDAQYVSGSVVTDQTGNGNNLVMDDGAAAGAGLMGGSMVLDGVNDYAYSVLNMPETDFTVAFWFKTTSATTGLFSVREGKHGGSNDRGIYLTGGRVAQRIWDTETITSARGGLNDGNWHHVAMVAVSGVGQRLYVDGVLEASGTKSTSDFNWDNRIEIGYASEVAPNYLNGGIDDIALWSRPLSGTELAKLYNGGIGQRVLSLYSNVLTGPTDGVLSLQADGSFNYVPAADFNGADTFSYQVTDSSGGFDTAQVVITITPVNDAPVITSAAYDTATEKISYQYLVTVAQPADEAPATVTILNYPGWCAASNDTLAGTAPLGSHGDTSFMVIVDDGEFADTLLVQLAIQDSDGYVPVTLSSFTAQALGAGVTLQWTTVSEHSNLGWNVMRSNSQNGPYQTINSALIAGAGTTVQPQQYAFDDGNVPTGTWYYLLEQVDLNGQKTYSAPVAVQVISTGISIRPEVAPESLRPGMELFNVHGQRQIYSESLQGVYFIKQGQGYLKILLVR